MTDAQVQAIVQSPRSLWDHSTRRIKSNSWITEARSGKGIYLLAATASENRGGKSRNETLHHRIQQRRCKHIAGTIAQADNLGVFGAQGLFAANMWPPNGTYSSLAGFRAFRDFDGAEPNFGDTSIQATSSNVANVAVYVSTDTTRPGRVVIVAINRSNATQVTAIAGQP